VRRVRAGLGINTERVCVTETERHTHRYTHTHLVAHLTQEILHCINDGGNRAEGYAF